MAGDSVIFNTRQRALSGDVNDLQSIQTRELADVIAMRTASAVITDATPNLTQRRNVVLGGLNVIAAGTDVVVSEGVLAQYSTTIVPTPGAYDSGERIAFQRGSANVAVPNPGSDTTYLLEAQMADVVTLTQTRDIFDPGTQAFIPTSVPVRTERQVTYRFRAGTATNAPAVDSEWVPLAIVFRPSGAPPANNAEIWDCRPLANAIESVRGTVLPAVDLGAVRVTRRRLETVSTIAAGSANLRMDFEGIDIVFGERLFARQSGASIAVSALPQSTLAAGLVYVYLYNGLGRPITNRVTGMVHRGLPVLSNVAPTKGGYNSANITLVQPPGSTWGYDVVGAGSAICVGAFVWTGAIVVPMVLGEDGAKLFSATALLAYSGAIGGGGATNFNLAGFVPADARFADVRADFPATLSAAQDTIAAVIDQATGPGLITRGGSDNVYGVHMGVDYLLGDSITFEDLPVGNLLTFRLDTDYSATQPSGVNLAVTGWRY